jgi:hypothetical protein
MGSGTKRGKRPGAKGRGVRRRRMGYSKQKQ